jgi:hypothetical protein
MKEHPNPAGREGKPISLAPHTFEDVVRKMLSTPPPPKPAKKPTKKPIRKK